MTSSKASQHRKGRPAPLRSMLAAALIGAAALAGCSAPLPAGPGKTADPANPFDAVLTEDLGTVLHAQKVMSLQCVADNGYPETAQFIPETAQVNPRALLEQVGPDVFFSSREQAERDGFGHSTPASPKKLIVHDQAYGTISDTCFTTAWEELGPDAEKTTHEYLALISRLSGQTVKVWEDAKPRTDKILQCLQNKGHPVTGGETRGISPNIEMGQVPQPPERPGPSRTSGVEILDAVPEIRYVPSPAESALAGDYYTCSEETGVRASFAQDLTAARKKAITENEAQLSELNTKITALAKKAAESSGR
jgi:hypothetical protein